MILEKLKDLAKENLNWEYEYGIQEYSDMTFIHTKDQLAQNEVWRRNGQDNKLNLLFHTNEMYNDILLQEEDEFYCYRNKPKRMKNISISGKKLCLKCGEVPSFSDSDMLYCSSHTDCKRIKCSLCNLEIESRHLVHGDKRICYSCLDNFGYCKSCGEIYTRNYNLYRLFTTSSFGEYFSNPTYPTVLNHRVRNTEDYEQAKDYFNSFSKIINYNKQNNTFLKYSCLS